MHKRTHASLSQVRLLFPHDIGIVAVGQKWFRHCSTTRLPENHVSRHSPPKDWKRKPRGREIFFGARRRAFFDQAKSVNSRMYKLLYVQVEGQRVYHRFFHRSFRSLIETATFFYGTPIHSVLRGAFPTKSAAGAIYVTRVGQEGRRVTWVKGPRFGREKQTIVNRSRKNSGRTKRAPKDSA